MIERIIEFSIRNRFLVLAGHGGADDRGFFAMLNTPIDAIPDLSENQVIVFTDWMGAARAKSRTRSPIRSRANCKDWRACGRCDRRSEFNFSMITIIFDDDIDFYFARQRVTEKLAQANTFLPAGVVPYLAPDATALGQIFWYTVEAEPDEQGRSGAAVGAEQVLYRAATQCRPGVADVAIVGGTPLEYQIDVRPEALRAYGITLGDLYAAVAKSNMPAGGGVIQKNNAEYIVRGVGWIKGQEGHREHGDQGSQRHADLCQHGGQGVAGHAIPPQRLRERRQRSDRRGRADAPRRESAGRYPARQGKDPGVAAGTARGRAYRAGLRPHPADHRRHPHADRSDGARDDHRLAGHSVDPVHVRSVFVICITLPLAVLFSFLLMWLLRRTGHHRHPGQHHVAGRHHDFDRHPGGSGHRDDRKRHAPFEGAFRRPQGDRRHARTGHRACRTVGRPIFFSVLIMLLSFVPVFMLSGREGKLFHPLAFTKSFAMIGVALISITVVPALIPTFIQGPAAERRRKPDRPQLHPHLQTAADLGLAAAKSGDVGLCRAAGHGGRHVSACRRSSAMGASETPGKATFLDGLRPGHVR